ncbi:Asp-tRNA(Asn)/Glu-tRNA(Gln) amidotransferase subunit GatB [Sedimentibacter hydroxybenzoicus DSM 7310]|uniref:Aspartyl/glutamyl-tRNA(Asn/Gln) amidotransferase subunit B n=1 Tax=Sedimentibacter hydroxybenzoicus DSM 7310 TaxID=1123245 RepID=A0A974BM59_SEDHY|nr:Asp-tRNA(Asn)/Glu-tRNA(Gln) amidotransferase subunit GatB [Sedimentibacter hydroxybenzoicus]NYB75612.1 Asp-tRNA(Asn)/Glu-tRNA(Gln) amidotransferase subunit GatB [Sedimentibacter hydroxybenzoicus DSM 7310]
MSWELVAGLETHVELSTKTKIFCSCTTEFGGEPNTHCCPVCVGLPGTLPKLNEKVVEYAVKAGLATNCSIRNISKMDRKNYVYPDLPKAYQISQYDKPLCEGGYVELNSGKKININRIHIEEDAGKLVHQRGDIYIDYNRGGVPLIEIVTEPDFRSMDEVVEYVEKLRLIMKYTGVSDVKMQEGSLRCDVNISVRKQGEKKYGTRTEIKNMNSINFIAKAMEYEFRRQIDVLESGGEIEQETRRYDSGLNITESMRGKEDADDYRYFREPDLVTISISDEQIDRCKKSLPELPQQRLKRFVEVLGLPVDDAELLIKYQKVADYFEEASAGVESPKTVSNYILSQIFRRFSTESEKEEFNISIPPEYLSVLVILAEKKKITSQVARNTLEKMLDEGKTALSFISEEDMQGVDEDDLRRLCQEAVDANEKAAAEYLAGKEKAIGAIIGFIMKYSKGKADAALAAQIVKEIITKEI